MECLSMCLSSSLPKRPKIHNFTTPESIFFFTNRNLTPNSVHFTNKKSQSVKTSTPHSSNHLKTSLQSLSFLFLGLPFPLSSSASEEIQIATDQTSSKINLESILVAIDEFFNKYPLFVPGIVFIWLYVIPATQEYLRKYKFISAIDAFKKLKEDSNTQLLDIRDKKTLRILGSPNLKILNKNALQVEFRDGDEEDFVKKVKDIFQDPVNTTVCILDNFDGDSMKVAELLFNNGFKEAYAIRGGVRGNNGWLEIQETLLPPSVHIYPKTKARESKQVNHIRAIDDQNKVNSQPESVAEGIQTNNGSVASSKHVRRSSSPYSMYPDMKPPSSPTPSKPQ